MITLQVSDLPGLLALVYLVNVAVASVFVSGLALVTSRLSARMSLPVRHLILLAGLGVAVASPILVILIEVTGCSLIGVAAQHRVAQTVPLAADARDQWRGPESVPTVEHSMDKELTSVGVHQSAEAESAAALQANETPGSASASAKAPPSMVTILAAWASIGLLGAWLLGIFYNLYDLLDGASQVRKLLRTVESVKDARLVAIAESAARSVGLTRCPTLWQSPDLPSPVCLGVFRARVVLPLARADEWSDEEWRFLLLHEMAHIERRDLWVGLLQRVAEVIYWWNPLIARTSAAVSLIREEICDDLVIKHTACPDRYAALIVELASRLVHRAAPAPILGVSEGSTNELTRRIQRLIDGNRQLVTSMDARTMVGGLAFSAMLLLSLTATTVHLSTAGAGESGRGDVLSLASATRPDSQRKAAPTSRSAASADSEQEKIVRVVDTSGEPIAGAIVAPWAMRCRLGHGIWKKGGFGESEPQAVTTDADGKATIRFPQYARADEHVVPTALTCRVEHPDYAESLSNHIRVDGEDAESVATIALARGAAVELAAFANERPLPMDCVYAVWTRWSFDGAKPKINAQGRLQLPRLSAGDELLRLAYFPETGPVLLSEVEELQLTNDQQLDLRVEMKPAVDVEGRLDQRVPRPITHGRVVAEVVHRPASKGGFALGWRTWAAIREDGSFTLESLPRGDLQVIALRDGFMAESGPPPDFASEHERKNAARFNRPQVFSLAGEEDQITLKMTPTADCLIRLLGPDGRAVAGAKCSFCPNVGWWGYGSEIYCYRLFTTRQILSEPQRARACFWGDDDDLFSAVTDAEGNALVRNLPLIGRSFIVSHDELEVPISQRGRHCQVNLTAGQQTEVTVTLQRKGTQFIGDQASP